MENDDICMLHTCYANLFLTHRLRWYCALTQLKDVAPFIQKSRYVHTYDLPPQKQMIRSFRESTYICHGSCSELWYYRESDQQARTAPTLVKRLYYMRSSSHFLCTSYNELIVCSQVMRSSFTFLFDPLIASVQPAPSSLKKHNATDPNNQPTLTAKG